MEALRQDKQKLILSCLLLAFGASSVFIGKTLVNVVLLTHYKASSLPLFYFSQAVLLMTVIALTSNIQTRQPKKFAFIFKITTTLSLIFFAFLLNLNIPGFSFATSLITLMYTTLISVLGWYFVSATFNIMQFKSNFMWFQLSCAGGPFCTGIIMSQLNGKLQPPALLCLMSAFEIFSLFCILKLTQFISFQPEKEIKHINTAEILKKNELFKILGICFALNSILNILVDFSLKASILENVGKDKITTYVSTLLLIANCFVALLAYLNGFLLNALSSKKMIILYPLILLVCSIGVSIHPSLTLFSILFCLENIFTNTTANLSNNLYLNALPTLLRNYGRLVLNGILKPISICLSSLIILVLTYWHLINASVFIIIAISAISVYLCRSLMSNYSKELAKSIFARRFTPSEISEFSTGSEQSLNVVNKAFESPDFELLYFGVQMLKENHSIPCPLSISNLLTMEDPTLQTEAAKIVASHPEQKEFASVELNAFLNTHNVQAKWYIAVYLTTEGSINLTQHAAELFKSTEIPLKAIAALIYIKQGNLEEYNLGIQFLTQILNSNSEEDEIWFLMLLNEVKNIDKEAYLVKFIESPHLASKKLALQQVNINSGTRVLESVYKLLGKRDVLNEVNQVLIGFGNEALQPIETRYYLESSYRKKINCIYLLIKIGTPKAENSLRGFIQNTNDYVSINVLAKYIAYRSVKKRFSRDFKLFLITQIEKDLEEFILLKNISKQYDLDIIKAEIKSRTRLIRQRILYYVTTITGSRDVLNVVPLLAATQNKSNPKRALAVELLDSKITNRHLTALLAKLLGGKRVYKTCTISDSRDTWLKKFIYDIEDKKMDSFYMLSKLRKINLFSTLAVEMLQILSESISMEDMAEGEIIFKEGDQGDGLYIINSGSVAIKKGEKEIAKLEENKYFGELALISDKPRFASAVALTEGSYFYLDKYDFDRITDEVPEIMKVLARHIVTYLHG